MRLTTRGAYAAVLAGLLVLWAGSAIGYWLTGVPG